MGMSAWAWRKSKRPLSWDQRAVADFTQVTQQAPPPSQSATSVGSDQRLGCEGAWPRDGEKEAEDVLAVLPRPLCVWDLVRCADSSCECVYCALSIYNKDRVYTYPVIVESMAVSTLNMAPYFTGYPFQGNEWEYVIL